MMITDDEVIMKHAQGCRARAKMECAIVNRILADASAAGYEMLILEMEGEPTPDMKVALFNLDEAHIAFSKDGKRVGWVYLVFGNSGWDLISDYTVTIEEFLKGANEVSDRCEQYA